MNGNGTAPVKHPPVVNQDGIARAAERDLLSRFMPFRLSHQSGQFVRCVVQWLQEYGIPTEYVSQAMAPQGADQTGAAESFFPADEYGFLQGPGSKRRQNGGPRKHAREDVFRSRHAPQQEISGRDGPVGEVAVKGKFPEPVVAAVLMPADGSLIARFQGLHGRYPAPRKDCSDVDNLAELGGQLHC